MKKAFVKYLFILSPSKVCQDDPNGVKGGGGEVYWCDFFCPCH